ncbi:MAG: DUF1080 domain-containing protein [Chitinophagaceae bacterium]|nr:MAG: DUF1080 domain-containing protein [Chitinophagaceae bacterium]
MSKLILSGMITLALLSMTAQAKESWQSLFNGKDLTGWETYLSEQPTAAGAYKNKPSSIRGVNNDPKKVFSVVDGTLRISGEEWGGLTSLAEFENFHLMFEVKWGEKKWSPKDQAARDSGILYFAVGEQGAQSGHWMRSHEFQVEEGNCGDYHSLDGVTVDAAVTDANEGDWTFFRYDPKAPTRTGLHNRILKLGNYEKSNNDWTMMEIIADGKTLIHKVNGHEVLRVTNSMQTLADGKKIPLTRGKFQIQSEGAEVFYRNIKLAALTKPAATY